MGGRCPSGETTQYTSHLHYLGERREVELLDRHVQRKAAWLVIPFGV
jgi:hypothetical protein